MPEVLVICPCHEWAPNDCPDKAELTLPDWLAGLGCMECETSEGGPYEILGLERWPEIEASPDEPGALPTIWAERTLAASNFIADAWSAESIVVRENVVCLFPIAPS